MNGAAGGDGCERDQLLHAGMADQLCCPLGFQWSRQVISTVGFRRMAGGSLAAACLPAGRRPAGTSGFQGHMLC